MRLIVEPGIDGPVRLRRDEDGIVGLLHSGTPIIVLVEHLATQLEHHSPRHGLSDAALTSMVTAAVAGAVTEPFVPFPRAAVAGQARRR